MYLNQLQISISLNTIPPYVHQYHYTRPNCRSHLIEQDPHRDREIFKWKTVTEKSWNNWVGDNNDD
jgi:hypothetical protein